MHSISFAQGSIEPGFYCLGEKDVTAALQPRIESFANVKLLGKGIFFLNLQFENQVFVKII